jgi:hypothetical protein
MRLASGAVLLGATVLSVACSSTTPGQPTAATTVTAATTSGSAGPPTDGLIVSDLGEGLSVRTPAGATVEAFERRVGADCTSAQARVKTEQGWYDLWLVGATCPQDSERALNGNHGRYLTPPTFATNVAAATTVPSGSLVTFGQNYTECTNSCDDYADAIGLITLSKPTDPDLPVLMIVAPRDAEGDVTTVTELANRISQT